MNLDHARAGEPVFRDRLLVVDDEQEIRTLLRILLEKEGWQVVEAANGQEAVDYVEKGGAVSLILLDIMMPVMDGIETAAALRTLTSAPILFLSARSSDSDKMAAYRNGGDDYIVKPFHAVDLRLKINAMLARYRLYREQLQQRETQMASDVICTLHDGITVFSSGKVTDQNGEVIALTEREYEMLCFFCRNRKKTLSPAEIYEAVWEEPYLATSSNTVIVHIANLRKKLEPVSGGQSFIRTVWGKGYRID